MKKILYIPAVIFILHGILSFGLAMIDLFASHDNGSAALHIIFTFMGLIAGSTLFLIAKSE